jgi:hypothetical protein
LIALTKQGCSSSITSKLPRKGKGSHGKHCVRS